LGEISEFRDRAYVVQREGARSGKPLRKWLRQGLDGVKTG